MCTPPCPYLKPQTLSQGTSAPTKLWTGSPTKEWSLIDLVGTSSPSVDWSDWLSDRGDTSAQSVDMQSVTLSPAAVGAQAVEGTSLSPTLPPLSPLSVCFQSRGNACALRPFAPLHDTRCGSTTPKPPFWETHTTSAERLPLLPSACAVLPVGGLRCRVLPSGLIALSTQTIHNLVRTKRGAGFDRRRSAVSRRVELLSWCVVFTAALVRRFYAAYNWHGSQDCRPIDFAVPSGCRIELDHIEFGAQKSLRWATRHALTVPWRRWLQARLWPTTPTRRTTDWGRSSS